MDKLRALPVKEWLVMIFGAIAMGFIYEIFIFPNDFAPAGFQGIATMIQYLFHFNAGYFTTLVNLPLLILAWRHVDRTFTIRTAVFLLFFSATMLILSKVDTSAFVYHTDNGTSTILGPIAAGLINGAIYSYVFRCNGCSGGTDIIAAIIRVKHPEASFVWVIFALNAFVAAISYFVYDFQIEPVLMCLVYSYLSAWVSGDLMKKGKRALKFEVVTDHAQALSAALMQEMHHGVTVLPAEGMYSGKQKSLLICIVNRYQLVQFHEILARFPGAFAYVSDVSETMGNFQKAAIAKPSPDYKPHDFLS